VISAATVVVAVFLAFALDPDVIVKMTCVGVAVGILIDVVAVSNDPDAGDDAEAWQIRNETRCRRSDISAKAC